MEQNKKKEVLIFQLMITSVQTLEREIERYNRFNKTDFQIINIIDDEVPFCEIKVTNYKVSDIFGLGFCLALFEQKLRERGEIDW